MNNTVLLKSKNCSIELEAWKKEKKNSAKGLDLVTLICAILMIYFVFGPHSSTLWGIVFVVASGILSYFTNKVSKSMTAEYDYFSSLCNTEYLLIYQDKICGECSKGDLLLSIKQIDKVTHSTLQHTDKEHFYNDQLLIYDTVGNCYRFMSFSNARELEMVIKNLINEGENK